MRELNLVLEKSLMIRRLKSEVLSELPMKVRQIVYLPVDRKTGQNIKKLLDQV